MIRHLSFLSVLPFTAFALACGGGTQPFGQCLAPRSIAIAITVTDSLTGVPLADSATGSIASGSSTDSLEHVPGDSSLLLAGDKLGIYSVSVTRPGYAPWTRDAVAVTQTGSCGNVIPVHLDAPLQAIP